MHKVKLKYPIEANGKTVSEISLRRPKVRDIKNATKSTANAADEEIALVSALSNELSPDQVEEIDMEDFKGIQDFLKPFFS